MGVFILTTLDCFKKFKKLSQILFYFIASHGGKGWKPKETGKKKRENVRAVVKKKYDDPNSFLFARNRISKVK